MTIIFCMNVYNEIEFIEDRLRELSPRGEVIVIDGPYRGFAEPGASDDGTLEVCLKYGVTLVSRPLWDSEVEKRNTYLKLCKEGDWVVVVDPDEQIVTLDMLDALVKGVEDHDPAYYDERRTTYVYRVTLIQPNLAQMYPPRIYPWREDLHYREHAPIWIGKNPPWVFEEVRTGVIFKHLTRNDEGKRLKMKTDYTAYMEEHGIR